MCSYKLWGINAILELMKKRGMRRGKGREKGRESVREREREGRKLIGGRKSKGERTEEE